VDCDLRKPSLSRTLAPKAKLGIVDVLAGEQSLDDTIWRDGPGGMAFLPAVSSTLANFGGVTERAGRDVRSGLNLP
jgi:MinD-like ATPase involved in chromosome partitioning or flagellar assembly